MNPSEYCMIMSTCPKHADADRLAGLLLEARLAACVQVMPITSYYEWESEQHKAPELLMLIKARSEQYDAIEALIVKNHPYEVPEIIRLPIQGGLSDYLAWIDEMSR
ncbi:divalent-cation tolerance protein CutA [Desulfonema ishimotonii]|uniref:Divalent-cation tolerance protein CutA n=1 Tax=Desulfonema ishimotonii TaxID=45657 RepID=A0A401FUI1_9BACT|nr:divalent-cation tolerance protein CutA [Desulfonema ishimotonii]GBC60621.1 divalent-cation tolerance protein CutA [Desulfonema ishimotonii]